MKLKKELVVLDIESTGVWIEKDRIIEIALLKYFPDGSKEKLHTKVKPGIPIPKVVSELTGITEDDVKDAPRFNEVSEKIFSFIGDADLGGFNLERFDLPLLKRELQDVGLRFDWEERKVYDAQKVYHLNEKRDLSTAFQFYCGQELKGAHSALADSEATYSILEKQVEKYGEGRDDIGALDQYEYESLFDYYDKERKFCWWGGKLYSMFGKYARKIPLEDIVKSDPGYLKWILTKDFSDGVKLVVRDALNGHIPKK